MRLVLCRSMKSILPGPSPGRASGRFQTISPLPGTPGTRTLRSPLITRPFPSPSGRWPEKPAACPKSRKRKKASASLEERADRFPTGARLFPRPMALLVLLPAAAGAGVVAAHFFARPALRGLARVPASRHAGRLQLPLLLAVELLLQRVDGRRGLPR